MSLQINPSNKIVVVGGGLIGPFLSLILKNEGFNVQLFEKRPDIRNEGQGQGRSINLVLTSRGIHALKSVNLWDKVEKITTLLSYFKQYSKTISVPLTLVWIVSSGFSRIYFTPTAAAK